MKKKKKIKKLLKTCKWEGEAWNKYGNIENIYSILRKLIKDKK